MMKNNSHFPLYLLNDSRIFVCMFVRPFVCAGVSRKLLNGLKQGFYCSKAYRSTQNIDIFFITIE